MLDPLLSAVAEISDRARTLEQQAEEQDGVSEPDGVSPSSPEQVDGDENKPWVWQDGFAPLWGDTADLQNDIPLDEEAFTIDSINQEGKRNCVALSILASIAHTDPEFLADHVRRVGRERYEVDLYIDGEWTTVEVSGEVARDGVRGPDGNQNWATIYEQALIQEGVLGEEGGYSSNSGAARVLEAVTGSEPRYMDNDPWTHAKDMPSYENVVGSVADGEPVVLCTIDSSTGPDGTQIVEQHAHTVESVNPDGTLTLVNPWGTNTSYDTTDGTHRITITEDEYRELFDGVVIGSPADEWDR
ncbi:hypothetical protein [Brachybacterium sp. AOP24-D1-21]|uniref:hypothetical protein n=1 Tax=Brachybacterium sp. AOP24-D1-21 TaxID=3457711 RepID=UPI0040347630